MAGSTSACCLPLASKREVWQAKYGEVMDALDKAEALWLAAAEKLERAESAA